MGWWGVRGGGGARKENRVLRTALFARWRFLIRVGWRQCRCRWVVFPVSWGWESGCWVVQRGHKQGVGGEEGIF